jgi:hypothetical protein
VRTSDGSYQIPRCRAYEITHDRDKRQRIGVQACAVRQTSQSASPISLSGVLSDALDVVGLLFVYYKVMSQTYVAVIVMFLSQVLPMVGLQIGSADLTTTIGTLLTLASGVWVLIRRYKQGGINAAGVRIGTPSV